MRAFTFLSEGARQTFRLRKLAAVFYLVNLIAAAIVVVPAAAFVGGRLGRSLESDRLFRNFDP